MYINFNLLEKKGFDWKQNKLLVMQCIHQKEYERLEHCRELLIELFKEEFIDKVQPTKKDTPKHMLARLSDKGKRFLKDLQIADITNESKQLSLNLISLYTTYNLKIDNKKKIVELVSWFLAETGFEQSKVYGAVNDYILSTDKKFVSSLNNLIWKGESVFSTNWNLSQSKLYGLMTK